MCTKYVSSICLDSRKKHQWINHKKFSVLMDGIFSSQHNCFIEIIAL